MDSSWPVKILTRSGKIFVREKVTRGWKQVQVPRGTEWRVLRTAATTAPERIVRMRILSGITGGIPGAISEPLWEYNSRFS